MGIHLLEDGRLCYPNRGFPPLPPDGYMVDPADPFIMIPIYDKCDHRTLVKFTMPCGRIAGRHWCKLHNKEATPETCEFCPDLAIVGMDTHAEEIKAEAINIITELVQEDERVRAEAVLTPTNHDINIEQTVILEQE